MSEYSAKKGYGLAKPDRSYALQSLERHMDIREAEQLWVKLCKKCEFELFTEDIEELEAIYRTMSQMGGKTGVTGSALVVRVMSYKLLMN